LNSFHNYIKEKEEVLKPSTSSRKCYYKRRQREKIANASWEKQ
jgi:hypothetical protein